MTAKTRILLVVAGWWLSGCAPGIGGSGPPPVSDIEGKMAPAGVEVAEWGPRCHTDLDCNAGNRCIHPAGAATRDGVCGLVVDVEGRRLQVPARAVPSCELRTDCPLPFACLKLNQVDGLCVK